MKVQMKRTMYTSLNALQEIWEIKVANGIRLFRVDLKCTYCAMPIFSNEHFPPPDVYTQLTVSMITLEHRLCPITNCPERWTKALLLIFRFKSYCSQILNLAKQPPQNSAEAQKPDLFLSPSSSSNLLQQNNVFRRDLSLFVASWKAPKYVRCNCKCKLQRRKKAICKALKPLHRFL